MKYALIGSITFIVALLIIVGALLLKMVSSDFRCEIHGTFNEATVTTDSQQFNDASDESDPSKIPPTPPAKNKALAGPKGIFFPKAPAPAQVPAETK